MFLKETCNMKLYRTFLLFLLMCLSTTVTWSQNRVYPLHMNAQFGQMMDRYTGKLWLSATLPRATPQMDRLVIYAYSQSNKFSPIVYHPYQGWIDMNICGVTNADMFANCALAPGQTLVLTTELTNGVLADFDLIIRYLAGRGNQLVETGYAYQCTRFGGFPFCLEL